MARLAAALADRYRIERELGAGGMASVHLAHDIRHDRKVAIKVLRADVAESLGRQRFLREIRIAAGLNHPHILPVHDSGECDGFLYFVMPVMQGQTLRERLAAERTLPVDEALRITGEIADALDYAHRHDVVHRDIKPENVLLHEGHAVVADFGIGKAIVAAARETAALTQIGVLVGTPAYMSPEQVTGDELDGRSDLFALGCVMYEMLTGDVAFAAPTVQGTLGRRLVHSPPSVCETRREVPAGVAAVVDRLLAKAPEDRYATGAQLVAALRSATSGQHATVPRPADPAPQKAIAVLPFTNLSADEADEFFSDGLTEEIISDLSGVRALRVTSRNSSMQLKRTTTAPREIGRTLGVRYLLTGSVRRAGNALRITAQLIDAEQDAPVWAEKYGGTMDDIFDLQERVSRAIVDALQMTLTTSEHVRLAARPIQNVRAFELYLEARAETRRYGAALDRAKVLLDRAVEIEGESPPLRALRAFMEFSKVRSGTAPDLAPLEFAGREGRALVELVPDAPYGHALLGFVAYERGDLRAAARHLTTATELDPADPDVLFYLAITYQAAGQIEPALALAARFHAADPLSPFAAVLVGVAEWFAGRPGQRLDAMEQALAMDPQNAIVHWAVGYTYALMGRTADAVREATWMQERAPQLPYTVQLSTLMAAVQGNQADALETLRAAGSVALDAHQTFHLAESFAMAGDTSRALELLDWAVEHGFYPVRFYAEWCPFMEPLRAIPEFHRIVARAARRVADFSA